MVSRTVILTILLLANIAQTWAQGFSLSGHIFDEKKKPVEFANILIRESGLWATSDNKGAFTIKNVASGKAEISVQCLGYASTNISVEITKDFPNLTIALKEENLKLDEVQVVARRSDNSSTTAYAIDRQAIENQRLINIANITSLLPHQPQRQPESELPAKGHKMKAVDSFPTIVGGLKVHEYWTYVIYNHLRYGIDYDKDYLKMVDQLSASDVKQMARRIVNSHRRIIVTMHSKDHTL